MRIRTLGWAGLEITSGEHRLLVDPFHDPGPFDRMLLGPSPELLAPAPGADGALLTHLHRDHADPPTLAAALRTGAPVLGPEAAVGPGHESVAGPQDELVAAGLALEHVVVGRTARLGPFTVTAVEAVDGLGDPQLSWVVRTADACVLHGGDTVWHGAWWRIAREHGPFDVAFLPANGPLTAFPWMTPAVDVPAALTPAQAVAAARALGARELVAIHHGVIEHPRFYRPVPDVPGAVAAEGARHGYPARAAVAGEELVLGG